MFGTVRHWWREGSGKMTLRLFAFEFVVVVAGVLVAQGLASHVQDRADLKRMEAERVRIRHELSDAHASFVEWHVAIPCLRQRMDEVMHGKSFQPNALARPAFVSIDIAPPDRDTVELIARKYGAQEKLALNWIFSSIDVLGPSAANVRAKWALLTLIDPANGVPSDANRADARVAAAEITAELIRIDGLAEVTMPLFRSLGIPAREIYTPQFGPAKDCAAIWESGRINPRLATE